MGVIIVFPEKFKFDEICLFAPRVLLLHFKCVVFSHRIFSFVYLVIKKNQWFRNNTESVDAQLI